MSNPKSATRHHGAYWLVHHRPHRHDKKTLHRMRLSIRMLGVALVSVVMLSVVAQLLYPSDRALPYMRLGGFDVGGEQRTKIVERLDEYAQKGKTNLQTPSKSWQATWQSIGVTIDREGSTEAALDYAWWERLLPFSSVIKVAGSQELPLLAIVDEARVRDFAAKLVAEDKQAAREATVTIRNGQVKLDGAKNGYQFSVDLIEQQIRSAVISQNTTLKLVPKPVPPIHSETELQQVSTSLESMLDKRVSLKIGNKIIQPGRNDVGGWLSVVENDKKQFSINIRRAVLESYLGSISKDLVREPGTSTVTILDGQEVSRTSAESGQSVDMNKALADIDAQLRSKGTAPKIELKIVTVPPKINTVKTYSQANSGLASLINDWEREQPGQYGVVVREINGAHRYADWQPDKPFVTSSTYKMFLAFVVLTKLSTGEVLGDKQTDIGWTVDECIDEMILHSTNPCAISIMNLLGWEHVAQYVRNAGFTSTYLNNQNEGDKTTTVRDETNFLLRLHAGTLLPGPQTDRLLGLMKRQVWRGGIPAGVPRGVTVADKVGFYNGYRHDVAIVYGPRSTYILGIMSKGGADWRFADLSRRVYNFFNQ